MTSWVEILNAALKLDHPYRLGGKEVKMPAREGRPPIAAAVLALVGFDSAHGERGPHVLLTVRSQEVASHKGQISFPGGVMDPGEGAERAALREAEEELGLSSDGITILGRLPELPTLTSGFRVTPVVAALTRDRGKVQFTPHAPEVDHVFWVPLEELLKPESRKLETYRSGSVNYPTPVFYWQEHRIWGATAAMIWNLVERIEQAQRR